MQPSADDPPADPAPAPERGPERVPQGRRAETSRTATSWTATSWSGADRAGMEAALAEARRAEERGEVPVGAVVVAPDPHAPGGARVVARGHNRTRTGGDPTAHAEMIAIRAATRELGFERLLGCTVYSTVEPCFMCAGALSHARVARVVWAVRDPKFGACASLARVLEDPRLNHRAEVAEGLGAEEARELLQRFFRRLRR